MQNYLITIKRDLLMSVELLDMKKVGTMVEITIVTTEVKI